MSNLATKTFALAGVVALIAGVGYGIAVGDTAGALLLVIAALAALILAAVSAGPDPAPFVAADAPAPASQAAYSATDTTAASGWPLALGLVVALGGAAVAAGGAWVTIAGIAAVLVGGGWLATVWREHPSWTPPVRERVDERLVVPVGMPLVALAVALFIAISVSRVLLSVSQTASWVLALIISAGVLVVLWFVADRPKVSARSATGLAAVGAVAVAVAGVVGAAAGEREFHLHEEPVPVHEIDAENTQFDTDRLVLPANDDVRILFRNHDDVLHNVAFYTSLDESKRGFWHGRPILAGEINYNLTTPLPGTYAFICDFHPAMTGTLVIEESTNDGSDTDDHGSGGH